ncbi:hypothetical protein ACLB2K_067394 [Fragaria x ananassa]
MALQAGSGVSTSQVLVLVGAGLTSSIILSSGKLSDLLAQLQELCKGVNEVEILPEKFDSSILRAQIQQLSEEIRELSQLTLSGPVTIYNGNSDSGGSYVSYFIPAAALGAMGYCYMKWKGWSFSDVMYVTRHNMANAVATVSKQLETVHETLAITRRHLTKKLEELDWKVEEQRETTQLIANGVNEVKSNLSQIGFDVDAIHQLVSGLIQQLSEEIRELSQLTLSGPVTIYNGNSDSGGSYVSYFIPAAALGAMGYCYMKWKGWSFSDVMYVTRHNMANAVATVSKQLETVHETLAITRRHLTKKLEELDWKVEEQREITQLIANGVNEVKSNLSQIGFDVDAIHQLVSGLEGKVDLPESKQDVTNSGLWYLCQVAEASKDRPETKTIQVRYAIWV